MNARARLRAISLIPSIFGLLGALLICNSVAFRSVVPPGRGIVVGAIVMAAAAVSIHQLWRGTRRSPAALLASTAATFGAVFAMHWIFPVVNASSEPPSFFEAHGWWLALFVLLALSTAGLWFARRSVAALFHER
jgi:hypothetical protein